MAGKQLYQQIINKPTWDINNQSTRSRIDNVDRLLSLLSSSRVTVFQLCSFQLDFKGHAVAIMEFPD